MVKRPFQLLLIIFKVQTIYNKSYNQFILNEPPRVYNPVWWLHSSLIAFLAVAVTARTLTAAAIAASINRQGGNFHLAKIEIHGDSPFFAHIYYLISGQNS